MGGTSQILEIIERHRPAQGNIRRPQFTNSQTGWAIAYDQLLTTADGGHTWQNRLPAQFHADLLVPRAVRPIDSNTCWLLAAYASFEERSFSTMDRGQSWTENRRFFSQQRPLVSEGLHFIDRAHGWIFLVEGKGKRFRSTLCRTEDGGQQWTRMPFVASGMLENIVFADRLKGWVAEVEFEKRRRHYRTILHFTADGGLTWDAVSVLRDKVRDIYVLPTGELFACGKNGLLANSRDSGRTWTVLESHTRATLESIHFQGPVGVAVGTTDLIHSRRSVAFLLTTDGGRKWRRIAFPVPACVTGAYLTAWDRGVLGTADALCQFRIR